MRNAVSLAVLLALCAPALAQDAAKCGGLLCDLGIVGNANTSLPCNDFLCRTFGHGRQAEAPPAQPVSAPTPMPEDKKPVKHAMRTRHAKVAEKTAATDTK